MIWIPTQRAHLNLQDVAGTHTVAYEIEARGQGDGFVLEERFILDNQFFKTISLKARTREDVADLFEVAHHVLHGMPPQGIDPRQGPTRLHPGPGR